MTKLAHSIVAHPRIYDRVQYFFGFEKSSRRLAPFLAAVVGQVVLEVGAGTGNWAQLLPRSATYIWLDNDLQKLQGFKSKVLDLTTSAILGDAVKLCLKDRCVDYVLCIAVAHHLSDSALSQLVSELARVARHRLIFLEPVAYESSWISALLWKYDRGSFPRSSDTLRDALEPYFDLEYVESYAIYHHYLLCTGSPKSLKTR